MKTTRITSILIAGLALLLGACGSLPEVEETETVSLQTVYVAPGVPEVDIDGNPSYRPGAMTKIALEGSAQCDIAFFLCAAVFVPVYAATGAVLTAADTLPEKQSLELNRATVKSAIGLNLSREFNRAIEAEALRQGLQLQPIGGDLDIRFIFTDLWWEVSPGNAVALHMKGEVQGRSASQFSTRRFSYRSERIPADEILADEGALLRNTLETYMTAVSEDIWSRILDRD